MRPMRRRLLYVAERRSLPIVRVHPSDTGRRLWNVGTVDRAAVERSAACSLLRLRDRRAAVLGRARARSTAERLAVGAATAVAEQRLASPTYRYAVPSFAW